MKRDEMIKELTQNEIDWVVGDPEFENVVVSVDFFSKGGFYNYSDEELTKLYNQLKA
jgi:hypothetical protein